MRYLFYTVSAISLIYQDIYNCRCEEITEVETQHQQAVGSIMGVAEDETPSSISSHPNSNSNLNPNQEGKSELLHQNIKVGI